MPPCAASQPRWAVAPGDLAPSNKPLMSLPLFPSFLGSPGWAIARLVDLRGAVQLYKTITVLPTNFP